MKKYAFTLLIGLASIVARAEPIKEVNRADGDFKFSEAVRGKDFLGLVNVTQIQVERFETVRGQPVEGREGVFWHSIRMKIRYSLLGCLNGPAPVFASASIQDGRLVVSIAPQFLLDLRSLEAKCEESPLNRVLLDLGEFEMTEKEALDLVFFAKYKFVNMEPAKVSP